MKLYDEVIRAEFLSRPNRFIAICRVQGREVCCHVKNTGRCKELLVPGCTVVLVPGRTPGRKTEFDLVAVYKGDMLVNMDSQAPNKVFGQYVAEGKFLPEITGVFPEKSFGSSRFDFYLEAGEKKMFAEVKGVTLEEDGVCRFPDAPTQRGCRHLRELTQAVREGYDCAVVFVVQMSGMKYFTPNRVTDPEFARELENAAGAGVRVAAFQCAVTEDTMTIDRELPVVL